jgi:hypothetical protein
VQIQRGTTGSESSNGGSKSPHLSYKTEGVDSVLQTDEWTVDPAAKKEKGVRTDQDGVDPEEEQKKRSWTDGKDPTRREEPKAGSDGGKNRVMQLPKIGSDA